MCADRGPSDRFVGSGRRQSDAMSRRVVRLRRAALRPAALSRLSGSAGLHDGAAAAQRVDSSPIHCPLGLRGDVRPGPPFSKCWAAFHPQDLRTCSLSLLRLLLQEKFGGCGDSLVFHQHVLA